LPKTGLSRPGFSLLSLALILLSFIGCVSPAAGKISLTETLPVTAPAALNSASQTPEPVKTLTPTHAAPVVLRLGMDSDLPEGFREQLKLPAAIQITKDGGLKNLSLGIASGSDSQAEILSSAWVYALVAPFPTLLDDVSVSDLQNMWKGKAKPVGVRRLLMTSDTQLAFQHLWGPPAQGGVQVVDRSSLVDVAWQEVSPQQTPTATVAVRVTPTAAPPAAVTLAIIPFEDIEPRWKVLSVDGQSPFDKKFDPHSYPLALRIALTTTPEAKMDGADLSKLAGSLALPTNYDPTKLTVLVMTGTTAISRHIGERMEAHGMTYPAQDIRDWLVNADLTHISNEVSFYKDCPKPGPNRADMRFCSSPKYIQLLENVGTDIVELTGNHILDWGYQPFLDTLEMYRQRGWKFYGGGANLEDANKPLLITHNGNRLAFLGCSPSGPAVVWATQKTAGSAPCNMVKLEAQVRQLRADGYLPIVTFQAVETDTYRPAPAQGTPDFRRMARAGAVIVSGSQSHLPQTMTLMGGSFVHYGLGNLFFDQMTPPESREEFIDQHVFYNGKYLGVRLLTALLEDYSRPRPMTNSERSDFLQKIFAWCNWNEN
jgi:hypothetical protein